MHRQPSMVCINNRRSCSAELLAGGLPTGNDYLHPLIFQMGACFHQISLRAPYRLADALLLQSTHYAVRFTFACVEDMAGRDETNGRQITDYH